MRLLLFALAALGIVSGAHGAEVAPISMFPGFERVVAAPSPTDPAWSDALKRFAKLTRSQQIEAVNLWVNDHPYVDDMSNWGVPDFWETPSEFLVHGGDCEDFAMAKYVMLRALGIPSADMKLSVGILQSGITHALLEVDIGNGPITLDNESANPIKGQRHGFTPYYDLSERRAIVYPQAIPSIRATNGR